MRDIIGKTNLPQIMEAAILFWWCLQDDVIILHEEVLKNEGNCRFLQADDKSVQQVLIFDGTLRKKRWYPVDFFSWMEISKSPENKAQWQWNWTRKKDSEVK